jgi:hypothetical protein
LIFIMNRGLLLKDLKGISLERLGDSMGVLDSFSQTLGACR